jgi:hypothetical protein
MPIGYNDDSFEDSLVVPFFVGHRRIRVHVGGRRDSLRRFLVAASDLQRGGADEESVIAAVSALATDLGLVVADILDTAAPSAAAFDVAELVIRAARRPTAEQAWPRILAVLTSATEEELESLMNPEGLARVRPLIRAVLDDLDDYRETAEAELRRELPASHSYLLLS